MDIAVRRGRPGDEDAIAAVHVAGWQAAYAHLLPATFLQNLGVAPRKAHWQKALIERSTDVWAAVSEHGIVGWIALGPTRDLDKTEDWGEVQALYVSPPFWRQGIGRELMSAAISHLRECGFRHVSLWVLAGNERARSFYGTAGFKADGTVKSIERGNVVLEEIRYERQVL
jgi:ribosomal protein S18 acetylase RimI-like enzyme